MERRKLGSSGLESSRIGLGCMSFSGAYGEADDAESIQAVQRALDMGVNHLDTSDMYGWGHNETLLGKALQGRREQALLATKFGQVRGEGGAPNTVNGRPEYVRQACEASLKRLGVDTVDLYYQHRVDPDVPIEETVGAMSRLVEQGKVRALGLSEAAPATIRRAHATHPIAALQTEYSVVYREDAEASLAVCRELGIAFVAYSPLGRGLLTGALRDPADVGEHLKRFPRFADEHIQQNLTLVGRLGEIAEARGISLGQLALAWLLSRGDDVFPIPGSRRISHLQANAAAAAVQLSDEELRRIEEVSPAGAVAGERYGAAMLSKVQL